MSLFLSLPGRGLRVFVIASIAWGVSMQSLAVDETAAPAPASALAQPKVAAVSEDEASTLYLHNRKIVTFRASLLGDTAADRMKLAQLALATALKTSQGRLITITPLGDSVRFEMDGATLFYLVAGDFRGPRPASLLDAASRDVLARLQTAVAENKELNDPGSLLKGLGYCVLASLVAYLLMRGILWGRVQVTQRVRRALAQRPAGSISGNLLATSVDHVLAATRMSTAALSWILGLLLFDAWATFMLHQFAYTRPWGERSTAWLFDVMKDFALATVGAVPGLITAMLIFVIARVVSNVSKAVLDKIERGEMQMGWLDADTAVPTRRLASVVIWLFALAMAYPYLPGANSEAFKGLTVLAGLMLSLGASGMVGQALSGLSLMFSRSIRVGEYLKVGDIEGTVVTMGLFTTKVHTGMGEEVSLPNNLIFAQPIRNFSRLVKDGRFMLHTAVTIGYSTPWRQVHALLLEAADRTAGVAKEPAPYVVQTALSDFYVEYRLCAQSNMFAPGRRIEAMNQLHANVLDVFNEHGVQIMSPHYMADTDAPQVVAPGAWASQPKPTVDRSADV